MNMDNCVMTTEKNEHGPSRNRGLPVAIKVRKTSTSISADELLFAANCAHSGKNK